MLGMVALFFIVLFCFKYNKKIKNNKSGFLNHGVSEKELNYLVLFTWLYLAPLLIYGFPVKAVVFLVYPVPFILLMFVPGILIGRSISKKLEVSGVDVGVTASRAAANNMWLGVGGLLFCFFNWLLGVVVATAASSM
jgi:hypothetical protein